MLLTPNQLVMLADCLDLGYDCCADNHVDHGGVNSDADLTVLAALEDLLRWTARRGMMAELTLAGCGPASLAGGGHDFAGAIEYLTPVDPEPLSPA